jgi:hypothetical protein
VFDGEGEGTWVFDGVFEGTWVFEGEPVSVCEGVCERDGKRTAMLRKPRAGRP